MFQNSSENSTERCKQTKTQQENEYHEQIIIEIEENRKNIAGNLSKRQRRGH